MAEAEEKDFICLRCGAEFKLPYTKGVMQERTCPKCGSNSVRLDKKKEKAGSADASKTG
jgi:ribosomal protein L40E